MEKDCVICNKKFIIGKRINQKVCGVVCRKKLNSINHRKYRVTEHAKEVRRGEYFRRKESNPIRVKAQHLGAKLGWGIGATEKMCTIINRALNSECKWCRTILDIENISLDHKIPIYHSKVRNNEYTKKELQIMNREDNLRIICKKCNRMKSNIPEEKYEKLLQFLSSDKELERIILNKLRTSNLVWK